MKNVFVLAEQRNQQLRDITWEAIAAGRKLARDLGAELSCILLSGRVEDMAQKLALECPKVLAVEDPRLDTFNSEAIIRALVPILQDQGPFVLVMGNSNSIIDLAPGLSVALAEHPNLMLVDVVMPKMDGITMLEKLREDEWGKDAHVIMLTNLSDTEKIAFAAKKGVNDYLVKADWDIASIIEKVKEKVRES